VPFCPSSPRQSGPQYDGEDRRQCARTGKIHGAGFSTTTDREIMTIDRVTDANLLGTVKPERRGGLRQSATVAVGPARHQNNSPAHFSTPIKTARLIMAVSIESRRPWSDARRQRNTLIHYVCHHGRLDSTGLPVRGGCVRRGERAEAEC